MEMASGQPVFLSLSFMRWRSECIVSFLSVIMILRRFISMAEQLSPPRSFAYRGKRGASGSLPWSTSSSALVASGESGTERCELLVFSVSVVRVLVPKAASTKREFGSSDRLDYAVCFL